MRFLLYNARERQRAADACLNAPHEAVVEIREEKTRAQEARYHAMLGDIARQCRHLNRQLDTETWKRLCVDQFSRECGDDPRLAEYWSRNGMRFMPALDGTAVVNVGTQTRHFPKYVASAFIEWLMAWGSEHEVEWSDPTLPPVEAYADDPISQRQAREYAEAGGA